MKLIKIFLFCCTITLSVQAESFKEVHAMYEKGNYKKSLVAFRKLCADSNAKACSTLVTMHLAAQGVKQSFEKAATYSQKACKLGDMEGCANLASMYLSGMGVKQDEKKAKELFTKACKAKNSLACKRLETIK